MLRQLLTLLAVIGGLTATVEPARALEAGVASVELAERQSAAKAQEVVACSTLTVLQIGCAVVEARPVAGTAVPRAPATVLKADRALE